MSQFFIKNFYKQRADFAKEAAARDKDLSFPEGVIEQKDIRYLDDRIEAHRLDIFRPANRDGDTLPVIVNVHGGGLLLGSKEFNRFFCARLSALGFLVYSIEYRLVPDCEFYEQLSDFSDAMNFIKDRIVSDHGDPSRVYAVGDSGGACLLVYGTAAGNCPAVAKAAHITPSALKFRALGLISGMFYTTRFDKIGLFLPRYLYGKHYKKRAFAPYTNPDHADIAGSLPPCFLITSYRDHLRHYTIDFEKALTRCHTPHELLDFPDDPRLTHAFCVFEPFMEESTDAITSMTQFLLKY